MFLTNIFLSCVLHIKDNFERHHTYASMQKITSFQPILQAPKIVIAGNHLQTKLNSYPENFLKASGVNRILYYFSIH